ncbi:MAG: DegT/DnrJ/EryC1/StrS family aminotransferase [FCB group bacterium]|nr:DegT/DnrJ/EryC1/StrS family aminotransferase [FCB group bacterium]
MPVPFLDLKVQYKTIADEIKPEINDVLDTSYYVLGPKVAAFESAFAALTGTKHCVAVSSGTAAVHLMLWAADLPEGSGIILPPNTFTASAEGIILANHIPVFVDVDEKTWNISPGKVDEFISRNYRNGKIIDPNTGAIVRGILSVDLYGRPADGEALENIADKYGIQLFEDAAQAHGASSKGRMAGSFGTAAAFSFYPGKNLGAYGEGGALTTNSDEIAVKARQLRDHGATEKYFYDFIGHNYRMAAIQGAVLGVKIKHLQGWNDNRIAAAERYVELLRNTPLELPEWDDNERHVFHLFAAHTPDRDALREYLGNKDIASGLHYPYPLHTQKAYAKYGYRMGDFPTSEYNCAQNITLPIFPEITAAQQAEVARGVIAFFS